MRKSRLQREGTAMVVTAVRSENSSMEDFMLILPEHMEWVDGQLIEKNGMTLQHSEIQINLGFYWKSYTISSGQGGKVYTDVPCRTNKQGRRPDVAYLTPELVAQFGKADILPQSFPLIAEILEFRLKQINSAIAKS
jgi:Uma2 family endonuclease